MTPWGEEGMGDVWFDRLWPEWPRWQGEEYTPTFDFYEKDGTYHLTADLPGVKKDDISVNVENNVLTVSGKRESEKEEKEANYYFKESTYGSFSRSVRLPTDVDEDSVDASFKDGVLKVEMKPKESTKARKIEIKT
jgi:HSP20 family protein